jgi:hypothetical protein
LALLVLIVGLLLAGPAAVMAHRFYTSRPTYLMQEGVKALERGDVAGVEHFADRLQRRHEDTAAHLLRGRIFLLQAKEQLEKSPRPVPYEGLQRASQMVLSGAAVPPYPPALRGLGWLAAVQVQHPFPRRIPGVGYLLQALGEFTQVLDDDPGATEATVLACECFLRLGDYRSAELALTLLVDRQPERYQGNFCNLRPNSQQGIPDEAGVAN